MRCLGYMKLFCNENIGKNYFYFCF